MQTRVRSALYALPVATVAVIALVLVSAGSARPLRVARVWGGPTTAERVSVRAEVFDLLEDRGAVHETPATAGDVSLTLRAPGFDAVRRAALDAEGGAELVFEPPLTARPLELVVTQAGADIARGRVELSAVPWARAARRRGGWVATRAGDFEVRVAPERGALAVPFEERLAFGVTRGGDPVSALHVRASATGARLTPAEVTTDPTGRAWFALAPEEHAVTVAFELADAAGGTRASFALPIVPGAMRAREDAGSLLIESPVPRDVAYFALVTQDERLFGGRVTLAPDPSGRSVARVPLPALGPAEHYAVVSSEPDLRSSAAVGWPLEPAADGEPERTFDAVEALLLDGRPRALAREARRRARLRWVIGAFSAAALAIELLLLVAFTRTSDRELDAHLAGAGMNAEDARRLAPKRSPAVIVALLAVALGFLVVALIGVLRIE